MSPRARSKLVRSIRRQLRVLIACFALVGVFGAAVAPAAVSLARVLSVPSCHCPHGDDGEARRACPCCHDHEGDGGCLPAGPGAAVGHLALAPPAHGDLVPMPALMGEVAGTSVAALHGRSPQLQLERPPRA